MQIDPADDRRAARSTYALLLNIFFGILGTVLVGFRWLRVRNGADLVAKHATSALKFGIVTVLIMAVASAVAVVGETEIAGSVATVAVLISVLGYGHGVRALKRP